MKIALGTVQLGMHYGVSNQFGQVKKSESEKILQYASEKGINVLDTASSYGNSENVIGDFVHNHGNSEHWKVITKTPNYKVDSITNKQIDELFQNFELSQKRIGRKNIYGLLIHNCENLFLPGGEKLLKAINELKERGVIKKIGVSLYTKEQVERILNDFSVDLVQLPINILDQRLIDGGQLVRLKKHNVEVHARSVFLQGLLLMSLKDIPSWFDPIRGSLELFHKKAKELNMNALQLSLGFVQSIKEIDKVVVGVNTLEQLNEVVSASLIKVDKNELSSISINDPSFLNPANWKI
jgi:aryl-alcohol dehydrogenase-like predicted oxidoreductase